MATVDLKERIPSGFTSIGSLFIRLTSQRDGQGRDGVFVEPYERSFHWVDDKYVECEHEDCPYCARSLKVEKKRLAAFLLPLDGFEEGVRSKDCRGGPAYKFNKFADGVAFEDVVDLLSVAETALIGVYGFSKVKLETRISKDAQMKIIVVDASSEIGGDLASAFIALLSQKYESTDFNIEKMNAFTEVK